MQTKINLQDIPIKNLYEGYLWWSNADKPEVFKNELLNTNNMLWPLPTDNPFIIEGNLWNEVDQTSYLIRYIDGQYLVFRFDFKQIPTDRITKHNYLPNHIRGIENFLFKEVWMPQADPLCEGFEVLKPTFIAFVGFKK